MADPAIEHVRPIGPLTAHIGDDYAVLLAANDTTDQPTARVFDREYAHVLAAAPNLDKALRELRSAVGAVPLAMLPRDMRRPLVRALGKARDALHEADGLV